MLRFVPAIVALLAFSAVALLYTHDRLMYHHVLWFAGTRPWSHPFIDGAFMFAMKECWEQGVDVYRAVPCDVQPLNKMAYSPLWQRLPFLPDRLSAGMPVGLVTDLLWIASLALLPPARGWRDALLLSLAAISSMVTFALERNNIDVWIYLLIVVAGICFMRGARWRGASYSLFMLAGLLKYYPFALFGLALKERPPRFFMIALVSLTGLAIFVGIFWRELAESWPNIPTGVPFFESFGIVNIPLVLASCLRNVAGLSPAFTGWLTLLFRLAFTALVFGAAINLARRPGLLAVIKNAGETDLIWLVMGALVISFCYLAEQNSYYRGIYLMMVLSGLLALCRRNTGMQPPADLAITAILIVPMMWEEAMMFWLNRSIKTIDVPPALGGSVEILVWAAREMLWLNLERVLLAILIAFALQSPVFDMLRNRTSMVLGRVRA